MQYENFNFGVSRLSKNASAVLKIALVRANPDEDVRIPASELLKGGKLELWMVPEQQ